MPPAPRPDNEPNRLAALRSLRVLDTAPERGFDELTEIARSVFDMPIALVSLVDTDRQWFKSAAGLDACETPRSQSVCTYVVRSRDTVVIDDLAADERTIDNPLVTGEPRLRFYAGAPITLSSGETVGSLCVLDTTPRSLTGEQITVLKRLASSCAAMLESRRGDVMLGEADRRMAAIQDAAPVALLHLAPVRDARTRVIDFDITDANVMAHRLLHARGRQLTGLRLFERLPGLDADSSGDVRRALLHAAASGDSTSAECDYRDRRFQLSMRWNIARYGGELVASIEDISEVRSARRRAASRESLMKQFVRHTPVAVAMFDTDMKYLVASQRWYSDNALQETSIEGMSHYDVFPDLGEDWKSFHRRTLAGESLSHERYRYLRPDGCLQWLRWQMYPWHNDNGSIGGIMVFTEDITDRAEQDLEIERSRDLLEQTQSLSGVGGWAIDLEHGDLHWTDQTFAIHGIDPAEGVPDVERAISYYAPEHRSLVETAVHHSIASAEPFDFEAELIRADGKRVPVRSLGNPVVQRGKVVRVVGAFQDLTRIRADEEQRDRTMTMLRAMSEGTSDLIFVKDLDGRFLFANPAMADFVGVPAADMLGKSDDELLPADAAAICRSGDLEVLRTGAPVNVDERIETAIGPRFFKTLKQPYRLSNGVMVGVITLCHDVTGIHAQEDERRRLTEIIKAITDASSDVIFVKDRVGKLIFCNPAYAEAVGGTVDSLIGTSDYSNLNEAARSHVRMSDQQVMTSGEAVRVVEKVSLPGFGADERIFETEKQPYRLPNGSIGGVIGVARDITDIRRALEELRTSDERLSFALSAASVGYWDHDMVSDRVYYADTWFTMLGYEPGELDMTVDCFWNELLHPDDRERVAANHDAYVRGEIDTYDVQCRLRHKDGGWHWIRDIGSIIERDDEGRPTRMVGVHVDVDDRKRQQDLLETALIAANEGIWEWNVPDNTCYFDDMWFRLLGYEPGELPMEFETWEELCHPDDLESAQLALGRYLRGESPDYSFEHRLWTKDGRWKWVLGSGRIVERDSQGRPTRIVGVNMDIDDRMHAAETLEFALDSAESANLAKSQFLANMSHEIRTPMTAIIGYADLMVNDPELLSNEQRMRDTAAVIQRNGEHLLALINDILDLSKIDAGKMTTESVRTDLRELVHDVYDLHRARASHKGIRLELQQRDALPDAVMADPVRIRQVLMNLVNNAIKFTESGSVTVRIEVVAEERGQAEASPRMRVSVIDTGIGMSESQLERLFSAFEQADDSMARRFGGTGLGLAISKRLAELMGGDVVARSRLGGGSTFTFDLPIRVASDARWLEPGAALAPAAGERGQRAEPLAEPLGGLRILLVEDGLDNQRLISHHLKRAGATVSIANNGEEGVNQVESAAAAGQAFDAVLMDMQMPVMDGYAATRALRDAGHALPIVALTAHAMTGDRERCLEAGCDEYETKPVSKARLIDLCTRLIRGERRAA